MSVGKDKKGRLGMYSPRSHVCAVVRDMGAIRFEMVKWSCDNIMGCPGVYVVCSLAHCFALDTRGLKPMYVDACSNGLLLFSDV